MLRKEKGSSLQYLDWFMFFTSLKPAQTPKLWRLVSPNSCYHVTCRLISRVNAYFNKCHILRYISGLWGMILKHVYAAYLQFIGDLEWINLRKSSHRQKATNFKILKLIFWSKLSTKIDEFGSNALENSQMKFQKFSVLAPTLNEEFLIHNRKVIFGPNQPFFGGFLSIFCCIFGRFWRHNLIACSLVFSAYEY